MEVDDNKEEKVFHYEVLVRGKINCMVGISYY